MCLVIQGGEHEPTPGRRKPEGEPDVAVHAESGPPCGLPRGPRTAEHRGTHARRRDFSLY